MQRPSGVPETWWPRFARAVPIVSGDEASVLAEPDHATSLVWRPGEPDVLVMGPRSRARYHSHHPGPSCLRLRLAPGQAAGLLDVPVRELIDRSVPLPAVARPAPAASSATLADRAAELLSAGHSVSGTARRLHVSERHLRDAFVAAVGLPPSRFVGIDRVRSVLAHLAGGLPEAAQRAGYYDQSHMTAEFRRLMGVPPRAFQRERWPAVEPCGQVSAGIAR